MKRLLKKTLKLNANSNKNLNKHEKIKKKYAKTAYFFNFYCFLSKFFNFIYFLPLSLCSKLEHLPP